MMSETLWFLGQYDRKNYQSYLNAVAQKTPNGWHTIDNPKKLFPPMGKVKLNGTTQLSLQKGEWVTFQVRPGFRNKTQVKYFHPIYPYYDLSSEQSLVALRRRLSFDGLVTNGAPGLCALRFASDGLVLATFVESKSGSLILSKNQNVKEYVFNENEVITVSSTSESEKVFYKLDVDALPAKIHDWSSDKHYIENAIQLLSCAGLPTQVATWLKQHSYDQREKLTSGVDDLLATAQSLRSSELAKKLEDEDDLTRQLAHALLNDNRIADLLECQIQNIAEEERIRLRTEQNIKLEEEFSVESKQRREAIDAEMTAVLATRKNEIKYQIIQLRQSEEEKLKADFADKHANIKLTLQHEKECLESEIACLKDTLADLRAQNDHQHQTLSSLTNERESCLASLADVRDRTAQAQAELDHINTAIDDKIRRISFSAIPEVRLPPETKTVSCKELGRIINEHKLLMPEGKRLMVLFLALMLAGECPLLSGSEMQDFLAIAESLISSGRSIRQFADPTTINGEDLWVRAGNNMATPLYQGLLLSEASCPRTIFSVIEKVECSAARFWFPALKDRLRCGDLSRRFLICCTIENEDCEEAEKLRQQHICLRIENVVNRNEIALSPLHLSSENQSELDPGMSSQSSLADKLAIADEMSDGRLDLENTLRAMRTVHEVMQFDDEYKEYHKHLVDLYADTQNNDLSAN